MEHDAWMLEPTYAEPQPNFEFCDIDETTQWTFVYKVMIGVYTTVLAGMIFICCTCAFWPCWWAGFIALDIMYLVQLYAIIITGIQRFNDNGEKCAALEDVIYYNEGNDSFTFASHGKFMMAMFIVGCICYCCVNLFVYFTVEGAKGLVLIKKAGVL